MAARRASEGARAIARSPLLALRAAILYHLIGFKTSFVGSRTTWQIFLRFQV